MLNKLIAKKQELENKLDALYEEVDKNEAKLEVINELIEEETAEVNGERVDVINETL